MSDQVKVTLVIDDEGSVKVLRTAASESDKAGHKLDSLDKRVKGLGKSFGGLKGLIGMGLGAIGVGGVAFGLKDVVSTTSELAEETHKFHSITGLGAGSSLRYVAALKARGIGAQAAGNAFGFLAKNIQTAERQEYTHGVAAGKAAQTGKQATGLLGVQALAFRRLGIEARTFGKLAPDKQFATITAALEKLPPGAEKTRLELQLMGKGAKALSPVLEKGALSLNSMTAMAKRFFPTIKDGAKGEEELIARQTEAKLAWEGLEYTLGVKLIPAITSAESWFSKLISQIEHGHGIWGTLKRDGEAAVGVLKSVWGWVENNRIASKALVVALGVLAGAWAVGRVLAFVRAIKQLAVIRGIVKLIKLLTAGDLLLTVEVGFLDAAAGVTAFALALAPVAAAILAVVAAWKVLDKVLPEGDRPENLFGGNQPNEKWQKKEGSRVKAWNKHMARTRTPTSALHKQREDFIMSAGGDNRAGVRREVANEIRALAREEHTTPLHVKTDIHLDARQIAEATTHYSLKRAARR